MRLKLHLTINRAIQLLLAFLFVVNVSEGLFAPIFAVYVTSALPGATLKTVGFAVALYALVKSLVQVPLARQLDRKVGEDDDYYVMLLGATISVTYAFGLIFVGERWHLYLLAALNGVGGACLMAAYYAIFSHHIDKDSEGFEWSLMSVWGLTISVALGGAVGGILADAYGFRFTFFSSAMLHVFASVMLLSLYPQLQRFRKKSPLPWVK